MLYSQRPTTNDNKEDLPFALYIVHGGATPFLSHLSIIIMRLELLCTTKWNLVTVTLLCMMATCAVVCSLIRDAILCDRQPRQSKQEEKECIRPCLLAKKRRFFLKKVVFLSSKAIYLCWQIKVCTCILKYFRPTHYLW